ncbi:helix-turn-helix domain-containing protein [Aneurinibacillus tyrosinisolvens]|uniref:helix-turn-helix domain-containing protein n=1 Tax=Aneurinibacillus tyrosinisolvens TaxID=1443435 RepID=UPI00069B830A|nr:helix-turn-helix domain-containing protein [Aneurinibacillus tyrosinisolvens]
MLLLAKNKDPDAILLILAKFKPKIERSLYQTSFHEREDLLQQLYVKIIEAVYRYDVESAPGFSEFMEMLEKKEDL